LYGKLHMAHCEYLNQDIYLDKAMNFYKLRHSSKKHDVDASGTFV
jgi:hypothetical protein